MHERESISAKSLWCLYFLLLSSSWWAGPGLAKKAEAGWSLNQTHRYFGRVNIQMGNDGILVRSLESDICGACLKPSWLVMVFSDKRRIAYTRPLSRAPRGFLYNPYSNAYESKPGRRETRGSIRYAGQTVRVIGDSCYDLAGNLSFVPKGGVGEYMLCKDFHVPKEINEFVSKFYDITALAEMPLKVVNYGRAQPYGMGLKYNKPRSAYVVVETVGNVVPLVVPPKIAYPKGYKEVDITVVTFGQKSKEIDNLKTLFGD